MCTSAKTLIRLNEFIAMYENARARHSTLRNIKVAIIDTGVDESKFEVEDARHERPQGRRARASRNSQRELENGRRFIGAIFSETGNSHWWLSADSHGTQMAKLISSIDSCCDLYIAKVGDNKSDISMGSVTRVSYVAAVAISGG